MMKSDLKRLYRMLLLVKKFWIPYIISTIAVSSRNLLINLLNAMLFSSVIISAQEHSTQSLVRNIALFVIALIGFVIYDSVFSFLQSYTLGKMLNHLRHNILEHILHAPMKNIHEIGGRSELISRINSDVDIAGRIYGNGIINPLLSLISGVGAVLVAFGINFWFVLWACILGVGTLLINISIGKKMRSISKEMQKSKSSLLAQFSESFSNGFVIKVLSLFNSLSNKFHKETRNYNDINRRTAVIQSFSSMFNIIEDLLQYVGTIFLGIYLSSKGKVQLNQIIVATQMVPLIIRMFTSFGSSFIQLQQSLTGAERIFDILNLPYEDAREEAIDINFNVEDAIVFTDLDIRYSDKVYVLKNFNGSIRNNKLTILAGPSGRGKSTLLKTILGLYSYESGSIKLWNRELSEYNISYLRRIISYVPQNDIIIEGTIKENLLLGIDNTNIDKDQLENYAKVACIHDFIISLPDGYDTRISEQSIQLSGGQRQCIGIARALLRDTPLLLLDEPFASMGYDLASKIIKNIKNDNKERTIILVSHDPQTLSWGDSLLI